MTFILGLNLSDRILLAADTKNTKQVGGNSEVVGYCIKLQQFSNASNDKFISCMFAGNKKFARYISGELSTAFEGGALPMDIGECKNVIIEYLKKIVPKYDSGNKKCQLIFAGIASGKENYKCFSLSKISDILGSEAGRIDDENIVKAMNLGLINNDIGVFFIRDQKLFKVEINEDSNIFGIVDEVGTYSVAYGGSHVLDENQKRELIRKFIDKRSADVEGRDILNYMRNKFSETIGGAVTMGIIDNRGGLIYSQYEIDRSGKRSDLNWSFSPSNGEMIAVDPDGRRVSLSEGWFNDSNEGGLII